MGPPGSGKGTQAARIAHTRGVPVIATGDMLRRTALAPTPLGRAVKLLMDRGELIDDEVMIEILSERIVLPDAQRGFVLDGFPRTVNQGLALDVLMENRGPVIVVEIAVPQEELIRRLSRRLVCHALRRDRQSAGGDARPATAAAPSSRAPTTRTPSRSIGCGSTRGRPNLSSTSIASAPTFCVVDGMLAPDRVAADIARAIDTAFDNVSA